MNTERLKAGKEKAEKPAAKKQRPDPARLCAARVLADVVLEHAFSNESLDRHLRSADLTREEAAFATALTYGTLSRYPALDLQLNKLLEKKLDSLDVWVGICLRLGAWQILYSYATPASAAVNESVKLCRYFGKESATGLVNAVLRKLDRARIEGKITFRSKEIGPSLGLSTELFGLFRKWYGEEAAVSIGRAFLDDDVWLTLRVNPRQGSVEELRAAFLGNGAEVENGRYLPGALRIKGGERHLDELEAYRTGLFMVQDEAAQLCGVLSGCEKAKEIIDVCAAPGGKTCDFAERSPDGARILAMDLNMERLQKLKQNAERLGLHITCLERDASQSDLAQNLRAEGLLSAEGADFVLADVPCSGLGLLRRKAEIRLRMSYEELLRFPPLQQKILETAASLVRVGGHLMYSTCTLNPQENENLVRSFLSSQAGRNFRIKPLSGKLPPKLRADLSKEESSRRLLEEGFILLRPDLVSLDGFFIALMEKEA